MPRALSREEQRVLAYVRRQGGSLPIPQLADELLLSLETVQAACTYLVSRGLLQATVYAVAAPAQRRVPLASAAGSGVTAS
jgi:DNA-binding transcriptional MocR family regulator